MIDSAISADGKLPKHQKHTVCTSKSLGLINVFYNKEYANKETGRNNCRENSSTYLTMLSINFGYLSSDLLQW